MRVLWRIAKYGFRYPWFLGGAFVMNLATSASALSIPPLMGEAIDQALASGLDSRVLLVGVAILAVGLLRGAFGYVQALLTAHMNGRVERDLRNELLDKLQKLSFGFYDRQRTGDLMSRATTDVREAGRFVDWVPDPGPEPRGAMNLRGNPSFPRRREPRGAVNLCGTPSFPRRREPRGGGLGHTAVGA